MRWNAFLFHIPVNDDQDEKMWDNDNVMYTLEDWKDLFGESDSDIENKFKEFWDTPYRYL